MSNIKILNEVDNINLKISSESIIYNYFKKNLLFKNNAMFIEDSFIQTNLGLINISDLNPNIHKISDKKINYISEFRSDICESILFKKDALDHNVPNKDTLISTNCSVEYKEELFDVQLFLIKSFHLYKPFSYLF